jgi:hypothetical protein
LSFVATQSSNLKVWNALQRQQQKYQYHKTGEIGWYGVISELVVDSTMIRVIRADRHSF